MRPGTRKQQSRQPCLLLMLVVFVFVFANLYILSVYMRNPTAKGGKGGDHRHTRSPALSKAQHSTDPPEIETDRLTSSPPTTAQFTAAPPSSHEEEASDDRQLPDVPPLSDEDAAKYSVQENSWPYESMEHMLIKTVPKKHWADANKLKSAHNLERHTGCNILSVPFQPTDDERCIKSLTDLSMWKQLKPLDQKFDERTIKFQVEFKAFEGAASLKSVLKVPQRLFPNEAFSEVASFHADRVMEINRIPPTGWVCIPTDMIQEAVAAAAPKIETVEEFLRESHVHNFTEWIQVDLFQYAALPGLVSKDPATGKACIGASIQLFMADVHHLLDSHLKIPYIPHNASWMRHFDFSRYNRPDFIDEKWAVSMVHLAEISMFDYVIGNPDRSPNKNNFVVGGCRKYCPPDHKNRIKHPNHPTYVHLDQGMGFYGSPSNNAITKARKAQKSSKGKTKEAHQYEMCLFRAPLVRRLKQLLGTVDDEEGKPTDAFTVLMHHRLHEEVMAQVTTRRIKSATARVESLLQWVDHCLEAPFSKWVLAP